MIFLIFLFYAVCEFRVPSSSQDHSSSTVVRHIIIIDSSSDFDYSRVAHACPLTKETVKLEFSVSNRGYQYSLFYLPSLSSKNSNSHSQTILQLSSNDEYT